MVEFRILGILKILDKNLFFLQSVTKAILVHIATFPALSVHLGTDVEAVVFQNALMCIVTLSKDVFILQEKEQQHHQVRKFIR